MRARDLMTTGLLTLPPDTPVHVVARLLAERGVSGAPVVDAGGRLLGMVTEGDLIRRLAAKEDSPTSWMRGLFSPAADQAARFARTHGRRARDVMTTELATVTEDTPIEQVAQILESKGIRRVPVVRDGALVGIVARADLIRALFDPAGPPAADAPDARIRRELARAMQAQPWVDTWFLLAEVQDGVVTFHGFCRSETVKQGLRVLAEGIPGVKEVRFETDATPPYPA